MVATCREELCYTLHLTILSSPSFEQVSSGNNSANDNSSSSSDSIVLRWQNSASVGLRVLGLASSLRGRKGRALIFASESPP
jgi:hypothetical protein